MSEHSSKPDCYCGEKCCTECGACPIRGCSLSCSIDQERRLQVARQNIANRNAQAEPKPVEVAETTERYVLIGTGEGASCEVVSDLKEGLHALMCLCGKSFEQCPQSEDIYISDMLKEMESDDNWSFDESGRRFQYQFDGYCYGITITIMYRQLSLPQKEK